MNSDLNEINIVIPMKHKEKDKDKDKNKNKNFEPPKEFRTIFKGSYKQPLKRMWRIIYDDGRLPIGERETFLEEYTLLGKTDFNCTDWISPDETEHTDCYHPDCIKPGWKRNISYIMDINSPIGPKQTRTSAEEVIQVFEPKRIIFQSTSTTPDVPYGSSFNTIIIQCLFEDEITQETTFEIYGYILWTGSCIIKKSIERFAYNGMIDHQKEMDEALNGYIEEYPNPRYTEDLISFNSPILTYSEPYSNFENITTLNNNLVYDNILEIKEKELENNSYGNRQIYCSSLANTFNSSYVNISERSVFEDKILKLKEKSYTTTRNTKWWIMSFIMILFLLVLIFNHFLFNEQIQ